MPGMCDRIIMIRVRLMRHAGTSSGEAD